MITNKEELLKMPPSDYMNEKQILFFKNMLEQQKKEILQDMDNLRQELITSEKNSDMSDVATTYELQQLELKRADRERKLLNKINKTLGSINNGDYGYCEISGDEIGLERMLARPTATMSITAKERQEFKEKTMGTIAYA
jgi:DnaK suppressor protein